MYGTVTENSTAQLMSLAHPTENHRPSRDSNVSFARNAHTHSRAHMLLIFKTAKCNYEFEIECEETHKSAKCFWMRTTGKQKCSYISTSRKLIRTHFSLRIWESLFLSLSPSSTSSATASVAIWFSDIFTCEIVLSSGSRMTSCVFVCHIYLEVDILSAPSQDCSFCLLLLSLTVHRQNVPNIVFLSRIMCFFDVASSFRC